MKKYTKMYFFQLSMQNIKIKKNKVTSEHSNYKIQVVAFKSTYITKSKV